MNYRGKRATDIVAYLKSGQLSNSEREFVYESLKHKKSSKSKIMIAILFPEFCQPCRLPDRFGQLTCVFRTYRYLDITPKNGFFCAVFTPKSITTIVDYPILQTFANCTNQGAVSYDSNLDRKLFSETIYDYFEQGCVRSAVIRAYYIGSTEFQKGYFCGAYDYSFPVQAVAANLTTTVFNLDSIENGFYKRFASPEEGIRYIWTPKTVQDLNFEISTENAANSTNQLAILIYGRNLAPDATIRVDIVRHIEGLPKDTVRPFMNVKRPEPGEPDDVYEELSGISTSIGEFVNLSSHEAKVIIDDVREVFEDMYSDDTPPVYSKYGDTIPL